MTRKLIIVAALSILVLVSCAEHRTIDRNTLLRQEMFDPCEIVYAGDVAVNQEQEIYLDVPDTIVYPETRLTLYMGDMKDEFLKELDRRIYRDDGPPCCLYLSVCGHFVEPDEVMIFCFQRRQFKVCSYTFLDGKPK